MTKRFGEIEPTSKRLAYTALHTLVAGPLLKVGFGFEVYGVENLLTSGGALVAGDHRTPYDSTVESAASPERPIYHIARHEWFDGKWGRALRFFEAIPLHRKPPTKEVAKAEADTIIEALVTERHLVGLNPEGTRRLKHRWDKVRQGENLNQPAQLLPGAAYFAQKAKVPTIPAAVTYIDSVGEYSPSDSPWDPLGEGWLAELSQRYQKFTQQSILAAMFRHKVTVSFGEPIDYPISTRAKGDYIQRVWQAMADLREENLARR